MVVPSEIADSILKPHFDAVRDVFVEYRTHTGETLKLLAKTRFVVVEGVHDGGRHFAGCREDGLLLYLAPESVELPVETLVAILAHEFGHAADFAYPARWLPERDEPARWLEEGRRGTTKWRKAWGQRNEDQVEWAADSIAYAVTGKRVGYCGPCLLQCFDGKPRPEGLK